MTFLNSDRESDNYWAKHIHSEFVVRVNGIDQRDVSMVDTDPDWTGEAWIERYCRLPNGRLTCDLINGRVVTEIVYGHVEIIPAGENTIEKGFFGDHNRYLNGVKLGFETEYLLTADYTELMKRQRNKLNWFTINEKRVVRMEPNLFAEYREQLNAIPEPVFREWLYGEWS